jgi:pyruvate-formate lyase-activating enzyme
MAIYCENAENLDELGEVVRDVQVAYDEALFALRRFHEQLEDGREAATEVRLLREYCRAGDDERGRKPSFGTVYFFIF